MLIKDLLQIVSNINSLSANLTKWSNTQTICQQFADESIVFDHFVGLALEGLR